MPRPKAPRSTRRKPSPHESIERLALETVDDAVDSLESLHSLFSQHDAVESLERVFLEAARAEYATNRIDAGDHETQEIFRFLSGGAVGYRLGLAVARRLAEVGR